jgi:hypothetical protein
MRLGAKIWILVLSYAPVVFTTQLVGNWLLLCSYVVITCSHHLHHAIFRTTLESTRKKRRSLHRPRVIHHTPYLQQINVLLDFTEAFIPSNTRRTSRGSPGVVILAHE